MDGWLDGGNKEVIIMILNGTISLSLAKVEIVYDSFSTQIFVSNSTL